MVSLWRPVIVIFGQACKGGAESAAQAVYSRELAGEKAIRGRRAAAMGRCIGNGVFVLGSYVEAHCLGLERLPVEGESLLARDHWIDHGGKGLNLGVGLHRLGCPVQLFLPVGGDEAGEQIRRILAEQGLDTSMVIATGARSGYGVGFVDRQGRNFLAIDPGANTALGLAHLAPVCHRIAASRAVCAQFEIGDAPIVEAFRVARISGVATYLNPSPWRSPSSALMALTDGLVVNAAEAENLFAAGTMAAEWEPEQWLARLPALVTDRLHSGAGWRGSWLVITLGERGCVSWQAPGHVLFEPAWPVQAKDATGAGDAFFAGLVAGLVAGLDMPASLSRAAACGALVVERYGVLAVLPESPAVDHFISSRMR